MIPPICFGLLRYVFVVMITATLALPAEAATVSLLEEFSPSNPLPSQEDKVRENQTEAFHDVMPPPPQVYQPPQALPTQPTPLEEVSLTNILPLAPFKEALGSNEEVMPLQLTPASVIDRVLSNNLDIAIIKAQQGQAKGQRISAISQFLPSISAQYFAEHFNGGTVVIRETPLELNRTTQIPQLNLDWSLPLGGETVFKLRAVKNREQALTHDLDRQTQAVVHDALAAYYTLLRHQQAITLAQQNATEAASLVAFHQLRFDKGVGRELEVWQSSVQQATSQGRLLKANNQWRQTMLNLATLLNTSPLQPLQLEPTQALQPLVVVKPDARLAELVTLAELSRPQLAVLQKQIAEAKEQVKAIRSQYFPTLNIGTYVGGIGKELDNLSSVKQAGIRLQFDMLRNLGVDTKGQLIATHHRVEELQLQLEKEQATLRQAVAQAYYDWQTYHEAMAVAQQRLQHAEATFKVTQARERLGVGLTLEVLQALSTVADARLALQDDTLAYNLAQLRLLREAGLLTGSNLTLLTQATP